MPHFTNEQIAEIAAALGHTDLSVAQTPAGRWFASCSCGYRSVNKVRIEHAATSAAHHMQTIATAFSRSGKSLPAFLRDHSRGKGANAPAAAHQAA